jgi:DNA-binding CsgD family transcriptional regulator
LHDVVDVVRESRSAITADRPNRVTTRALPEFYILDSAYHVVTTCGNVPLEDGKIPGRYRRVAEYFTSTHQTETFVAFVDDRYVRVVRTPNAHLCVLLETSRVDPVIAATQTYALTPRESSVLRLLLRGHRTESIATELAIAPTTAADYTKRIISKTGSQNRAQVVARILGHLEAESLQ